MVCVELGNLLVCISHFLQDFIGMFAQQRSRLDLGGKR